MGPWLQWIEKVCAMHFARAVGNGNSKISSGYETKDMQSVGKGLLVAWTVIQGYILREIMRKDPVMAPRFSKLGEFVEGYLTNQVKTNVVKFQQLQQKQQQQLQQKQQQQLQQQHQLLPNVPRMMQPQQIQKQPH